LKPGVNAISHANGSVTPFVTFTPLVTPSALAVDPATHTVYVGTSTGATTVYKWQITNPTATTATATQVGTVALSGNASPTGLAWVSGNGTPATLFVLDFTNGLIQSYVSGALTFNLATGLSSSTGGIVVCN